MGWAEGSNWETEIIRAHIVAKLGAERAATLEAGYATGQPLIIPPGVEYKGINLGILEQYEAIKQLSGFGLLGASNSWVVDGSLTVTGSPILCNDPHLGQAAPSIWYECHLVAGDIDVIGASFPGRRAWYRHWPQPECCLGLTNAVSDVEDLYIEKFHPQNPYQYEYKGQWEEAQVFHEEIKVKGSQNSSDRGSTRNEAWTHPDYHALKSGTATGTALDWTGTIQYHYSNSEDKPC